MIHRVPKLIKTIILSLILLLTHCKSKNEFEGQFLAVIELSALDASGNALDFNVGYTVEFKPIENQDCLVESKDELNAMLVEPTIRSAVRGFVRQKNTKGVDKMDIEKVKAKINRELSEADISVNTKKFVDCPLTISMLTITERN